MSAPAINEGDELEAEAGTVAGDSEGECDDAPPRPVWKPDISHLPDAVQLISGVPTLVVGKGDRVLIDYSKLKYGAWLDTRCWVIDSVRDDGFVGLVDPNQNRKSCTNWQTGVARGLVFKVPRSKEDWTFGSSTMSRKRAARAVARAVERDKHAGPAGSDPAATRKVGRPKGKLNQRTVERLRSAGHDPDSMTRQEVDEAMAKIRREEYERARDERRAAREAEKREKKGA